MLRDRIARSPVEAAAAAPLGDSGKLDRILDLPLEVTVRLGRTRLLIRDLLRLDKNSVIELDQNADDPLDIVVNDQILARGEVVVMEDRLGIRITDIVSRVERVEGLGTT